VFAVGKGSVGAAQLGRIQKGVLGDSRIYAKESGLFLAFFASLRESGSEAQPKTRVGRGCERSIGIVCVVVFGFLEQERRDESRRCRHECPRHVLPEPCATGLGGRLLIGPQVTNLPHIGIRM
jgi:hypothetical protein